MRFRSFANLLLLFACAIPCVVAQTAIQVTPCDLVTSPEKYAGKVVQVRTRVFLAFEDFSLAQPGCEDKHPGIWLMYGGDEPTPTSSTWNDVSRKAGSVVKIDGISVPLVHDADLDLFKRRLTAVRLGSIGDSQCYESCYLYHVTATLTGLFFAATDTAQQHSGYGHLGCCHLLAIEKVADVIAERTVIPAASEIQCNQDSKTLTQKETERLNRIRTSCEKLSHEECLTMHFRQMEAVAALWGDALDIHMGYEDGNYGEADGHTEHSGWRTLDRLKYYELSIQSENRDDPESRVFGGSAIRISCKELTPPLPPTMDISCREVHKRLLSTPADSKRKFKESDFGDDLTDKPDEMQSLRNAAAPNIDVAASKLELSIEPGAKAVDCESAFVYRGKALGKCFWTNNTGTLEITVNLMRSWPAKKSASPGESPWALTSVGASVCEAEK